MPTTPTDVQIPTRLPVVPGLMLHGTYVLTDREPINRGDTLDAAVLPDQRVALLVADVVGHGFAASMAATQVRTVLRERLVAGAGPAGAAEALDSYLRHLPDLGAVTACLAVMEPSTGDVEHLSFGHCGPLVMRTDGGVRRASRSTPYPPLGAAREEPLRSGHLQLGHLRLDEGELLVLHTDGIDAADVERAMAGVQLSAAPNDPADRIDHFCGEAVHRLIPAAGLPDDAVLLGALRTAETEPLSVSFPAERSSIDQVRRALDLWLDEVGAGLLDHAGLLQALDEITTNVVDHAYPHAPPDITGTMSVSARLGRSGTASVTVTDYGAWSEDAPVGFGLMLAAGLTDSFRVTRDDLGSSVELCHELTRPVSLVQAVGAPGARQPEWEAELDVETRPGVVCVTGAVDDLSAELFHAAVNEASEVGNRSVVIDLRGATRVASPGIQSLHEFLRRARHGGADVEIVAREGSLVARALSLTAVPFRATR